MTLRAFFLNSLRAAPVAGVATFAALAVQSVGQLSAQDDESKRRFVVRTETAVSNADDEEEYVEIEMPKLWLGIVIKEIEGDLAKYLKDKKGILVQSVYPGSPAEKAGVEEGDVLLKSNGKELVKLTALLDTLSVDEDVDGPKSVKLVLLRSGEKKELVVTPEQRPQDLVVAVGEEAAGGKDENRFEFHVLGDEEGDVEDIIAKIREGRPGKVMELLRLGSPALLGEDSEGIIVLGNKDIEGDIDVTVNVDKQGVKTSITVKRVDGKPAVITVEKDGETSEYTVEELADLPEDVRVLVEPMVQGFGGSKKKGKVFSGLNGVLRLNSDGKVIDAESLMNAENMKALRERLGKEVGARRESMEKAVAEARKAAEKTRVRVRELGIVPEEVKGLKQLVEELQAEVAELRNKLKEK